MVNFWIWQRFNKRLRKANFRPTAFGLRQATQTTTSISSIGVRNAFAILSAPSKRATIMFRNGPLHPPSQRILVMPMSFVLTTSTARATGEALSTTLNFRSTRMG